jgi:hypothetical protein
MYAPAIDGCMRENLICYRISRYVVSVVGIISVSRELNAMKSWQQ